MILLNYYVPITLTNHNTCLHRLSYPPLITMAPIILLWSSYTTSIGTSYTHVSTTIVLDTDKYILVFDWNLHLTRSMYILTLLIPNHIDTVIIHCHANEDYHLQAIITFTTLISHCSTHWFSFWIITQLPYTLVHDDQQSLELLYSRQYNIASCTAVLSISLDLCICYLCVIIHY